MAPEHKTLLFADVSKHNKTDDCWVIISGKVYNVTQFMEEHPGGSEVILAATGKDATEDFEDTGHSDEAKELMGKYYIGKIEESSIPKKRSYDLFTTEKTYSSSTTSSSDPTRELIIKILKFLVPFMILGLAFTVRG